MIFSCLLFLLDIKAIFLYVEVYLSLNFSAEQGKDGNNDGIMQKRNNHKR